MHRMTSTIDPDAAASSDRRPGSKGQLRVFIVENHEDTRFLLGLLLEQLGHTVLSAASVGDALAAIPGAGCDVLISDVGLPDGNGWELLQRLGNTRPRYAVAMSGFGMSSDRERSHAAGYRHHLLKPVVPNQLEHLLDEAAAEMAA